MPVVPGQPSQVPRIPSAPKIDPTYLMMAAATMNEQGRLFEPVAKLDYGGRSPMNDGITAEQELRDRHTPGRHIARDLKQTEKSMEQKQLLNDVLGSEDTPRSKRVEQDI